MVEKKNNKQCAGTSPLLSLIVTCVIGHATITPAVCKEALMTAVAPVLLRAAVFSQYIKTTTHQ